jgi:uncharacterized damage-inducible protein DinB
MPVDRSILVTLFDHILEGREFPTPMQAMNLKSTSAAETKPGVPYSAATNLVHAVLWQDFWLKRLDTGKRGSESAIWFADSWKPASDEAWEGLRKRLVAGLVEARRIAASEPFDHRMDSDDAAAETLLRIALHTSYHLGQLNLLRRIARKRLPANTVNESRVPDR